MDTIDESLEKKLHIKEETREDDDQCYVGFVDVIGWFNRSNKGFSSYPKLVSRKAWDKEQYIFYVQGSTFQVNRVPLLGIFEEGKEISYHPHIDMHHPDGTISTWVPSSVDLFADDYYISNAPEEIYEEEIADFKIQK